MSKLKNLVLDYERRGEPYSAKILANEISKPLPSTKTLLELIDDRVRYFMEEKVNIIQERGIVHYII